MPALKAEEIYKQNLVNNQKFYRITHSSQSRHRKKHLNLSVLNNMPLEYKKLYETKYQYLYDSGASLNDSPGASKKFNQTSDLWAPVFNEEEVADGVESIHFDENGQQVYPSQSQEKGRANIAKDQQILSRLERDCDQTMASLAELTAPLRHFTFTKEALYSSKFMDPEVQE